MSPGVRKMPAPIVFPTVTARPNESPRIFRSDCGRLTAKGWRRIGEFARDGLRRDGYRSRSTDTIPPKPRFHEMRPAPTRAGAAFTKALLYKTETRVERNTPTRQPPIVNVPLVAS